MPSSSVPDSTAAAKPAGHARATQAERRTRTREALLESAARGLSRYGYGNLVLEQVARDAGLTRGALYHLFDGKDDLALASVDWVAATWDREVGEAVKEAPDPAAALLTWRAATRSSAGATSRMAIPFRDTVPAL
jgi:AcrR family transcriptional regulator